MSSASPPPLTTPSIVSSAASVLDIGALEAGDARAVVDGTPQRRPSGQVDVHERWVPSPHQRFAGPLDRGKFERDARPPDARDAREALDLVVKPRRREVLDVVRAHDELARR